MREVGGAAAGVVLRTFVVGVGEGSLVWAVVFFGVGRARLTGVGGGRLLAGSYVKCYGLMRAAGGKQTTQLFKVQSF